MIHAYDKVYLDKARTALGRMLDFAVYDLKIDLTEFFDLFIASGVASRFEQNIFSELLAYCFEILFAVSSKSKIDFFGEKKSNCVFMGQSVNLKVGT